MTETPRVWLEIKHLLWLRSEAAGAALRAGAASPSTQPPPLLLPSEAPLALPASGSAPSPARKTQKWSLNCSEMVFVSHTCLCLHGGGDGEKDIFGVALTAFPSWDAEQEEFRDHAKVIPALERCRKLLGEV